MKYDMSHHPSVIAADAKMVEIEALEDEVHKLYWEANRAVDFVKVGDVYPFGAKRVRIIRVSVGRRGVVKLTGIVLNKDGTINSRLNSVDIDANDLLHTGVRPDSHPEPPACLPMRRGKLK